MKIRVRIMGKVRVRNTVKSWGSTLMAAATWGNISIVREVFGVSVEVRTRVKGKVGRGG